MTYICCAEIAEDYIFQIGKYRSGAAVAKAIRKKYGLEGF